MTQQQLMQQRMATLARLQANIEASTTADENLETRGNESMSTVTAGKGAEYVKPNDMSSQIIATVRDMETFVSKLGNPIIMPTATYTIPVEWSDPTFTATSENTDVPGTDTGLSTPSSGAITLTAKKYSALAYISWELDEDSILNINNYLVDKFSLAFSELLDKVWYNSDILTTTANINTVGVAPTAKSYFLHADGLIKSAFTENKIVNIGALDLADIRTMRKALGKKWLNPSKLLLIVDTGVYFALLGLGQAETVEKFGGRATVVNGTISAIDGIEVLPASLIDPSDVNGKIDAVTPANNTKWRLLLVYKDELIHGFKRQLEIFTEYLPVTDQFRFIAHTRYAIKVKPGNVVLWYNATV